MTSFVPSIFVANWKMHGVSDKLREIEDVYKGLNEAFLNKDKDEKICIFCLPATLLSRAHDLLLKLERMGLKKQFFLGGQDCHFEKTGAFTGDLSADMLKDAGACHVILGHSERRNVYKETSEKVCAKFYQAIESALIPIVCVGESEEQYESGETVSALEEQILHSIPFDLLKNQIKNKRFPFILAYEPVWAIGSGKTPLCEEIENVHNSMRNLLIENMGRFGEIIPLLYGGSVKEENAQELLKIKNVNGVLVGGASLNARAFLPICNGG